MAKKSKSKSSSDALATNRRARHDYQVLETMEAGIELKGTEVKSLRLGHCSIEESFAMIENGQAFLYDLTIQPYAFGNQFNHDPRRVRRLLLHRREIHQLNGLTREKGLTLIPLKIYLKNGKVKILVGICRGKNVVDKRDTLKARTADREMQRAMRRH